MKKLDEGMKGTMADYNAVCIKETAIMDVYPYEAKEDDKPEFPSEQQDASPLNKVAQEFADSVPEGTKVTISSSVSPNKIVIDKTKEENDIRGDD